MRTTVTSLGFWAFVLIAIIPVVSWYGPGIEQRWLPVLSDQVMKVTRDGDRLTFTIEVTKNRDCRLVQAGYAVVRGIERTPIIVRTAQAAPTVSYPVGRHRLGPFTAELPEMFRDANRIEGTLYYDCHPGWLTRQYPFGPVPVPPPG